jgi:O-antigen/teichoic acid export membrane protein
MEDIKNQETPPLAKGNEINNRSSHTESGRWIFSSTALGSPIRLLMHVCLARLLQPAAFGILGLATSTAISLCGLSTLGLDVGVNRFTAENYRRDPPAGRNYAVHIFFSLLTISTFFFLSAFGLLPYWRGHIFPVSTPHLTICICLLLGFTHVIATYGVNLLNGLQLFRVIATSIVLQNVVTLVAAMAGAAMWGDNGAIAGYWIASLFCIGYFAWELYRFDPQLFKWNGSILPKDLFHVFRFSVPVWLGSLAMGPAITYSMSILSRQPGGAIALGIFTTANPLRILVGVLPGIVGTVMGPAILEEGGRLGHPAAYERHLQDSLIATSFLTLPVLSVLLGFRSWIFLIYGRSYIGSSEVFVPLAVCVALSFIAAPAQFAMLAKNKIWPLQFLGIMHSILILTLALLWVPGHLGQGLAWALLAAELVTAISMQEYCIITGVTPTSLRPIFYAFIALLSALYMAVLSLPQVAFAVLSIPASLVLAFWIIRRHPSTETWIVNASPAALKPRVRQVLDFGAKGFRS